MSYEKRRIDTVDSDGERSKQKEEVYRVGWLIIQQDFGDRMEMIRVMVNDGKYILGIIVG